MAAAAGGNDKQRRRLDMTREWTKWDVFAVVNCLPPHLLTLVAPFYFSWGAFWFAIVLANTTGLLGINLSYHRHLCHKSFKIPKWLEYFFAYLGLHALQGDPGYWVSTHRFHHQHSDTDRDPHSPAEGFWFSHLGWIFNSTSIKGKCGRRQNVGDLDNQAFYRWLHKTYFLHPISLGVLLYKYGGLPYLFWGMGFRVVLCHHLTWLVNSAAHTWGTQAWNTNDLSRNNWWVAMMTFGEGWHNNHHAFNSSARHGLEWWQIDVTWYVVKFLQVVGLASDVKIPTRLQMEKMAIKNR
ncbi:unnamed protein product [Linum trigynum]|uniref:Fatty acid desaturase domain-containing protein n=1 Tax=Linum trigynum TaxID=586398 RepID=A0AAV2CJL2_9ROSI